MKHLNTNLQIKIPSLNHSFYSSFIILFCSSQFILPDGSFSVSYSPHPKEWFHLVLNYIGPNDGEGIRLYLDAVEVSNDTSKSLESRSAGDGRIVVGRLSTNSNGNYASVQVDELIYFNRALTTAEVQLIYNSLRL